MMGGRLGLKLFASLVYLNIYSKQLKFSAVLLGKWCLTLGALNFEMGLLLGVFLFLIFY